MSMMLPSEMARVCHEANRALQALQTVPGIPVAAPWDEFPEDERAGVIAGVEEALAGATPEELHQAWCDRKLAEGWVYGPIKNAEAKTHPCLVSYGQLPAEQRMKDRLFAAVVFALSPSSVPPRVRVIGPIRQRKVIVDGIELPYVRAVRLDEQVGQYPIVTVDISTDDAQFESPRAFADRDRAVKL